jgi:hypothetical protein
MKFIQLKEYQEYKLFMSEYNVYENRKAELTKIYRELEERIRKLEQALVQNLLNKELEEISIDTLVRAWKIGEGTVLRLYPRFHFFMIHEIGMSFSRENHIETIHFGEIERCSKIGNKILLILSKKGRTVIKLRKNAGIVYNYIKTYEDYHE